MVLTLRRRDVFNGLARAGAQSQKRCGSSQRTHRRRARLHAIIACPHRRGGWPSRCPAGERVAAVPPVRHVRAAGATQRQVEGRTTLTLRPRPSFLTSRSFVGYSAHPRVTTRARVAATGRGWAKRAAIAPDGSREEEAIDRPGRSKKFINIIALSLLGFALEQSASAFNYIVDANGTFWGIQDAASPGVDT